jgi:hypothetical protein
VRIIEVAVDKLRTTHAVGVEIVISWRRPRAVARQ